jgi:DNA-binding CsgD family transcriptional regulator
MVGMQSIMATSRPLLEGNIDAVERLFADRTVNGVLLDRSGTIVYVSQGWKSFARDAGFALPDYGLGQNYLRHCAYADQESARIVEGLTQLLAGRVDCLSFIYPCHSPTERRWFLLLGFPHVGEGLTALLHLDITAFMPATAEKLDPVILLDRFGGAAAPALFNRSQPLNAEAAAAEPPAAGDEPQGSAQEARSGTPAPALSKRQQEVLGLMAKGMSNVEIGRALAISPNTVKIHVSGILARLGLPSRAQAIHWTLTRGPDRVSH